MCSVHVAIQKRGKLVPGRKLVPACQVPVAEGVTVKTETPRVKDQQRATLEFLLRAWRQDRDPVTLEMVTHDERFYMVWGDNRALVGARHDPNVYFAVFDVDD